MSLETYQTEIERDGITYGICAFGEYVRGEMQMFDYPGSQEHYEVEELARVVYQLGIGGQEVPLDCDQITLAAGEILDIAKMMLEMFCERCGE